MSRLKIKDNPTKLYKFKTWEYQLNGAAVNRINEICITL